MKTPPCLSSDPVLVRLQEGAVANFTVLRAGRADFVATVMYRIEYGDASPGDLTVLSNDTLLVYDVGEWMKNISVAVEDDDMPETDEPFYIVLYNATGEYRLYFKQDFLTWTYFVLDIFFEPVLKSTIIVVLYIIYSSIINIFHHIIIYVKPLRKQKNIILKQLQVSCFSHFLT